MDTGTVSYKKGEVPTNYG